MPSRGKHSSTCWSRIEVKFVLRREKTIVGRETDHETETVKQLLFSYNVGVIGIMYIYTAHRFDGTVTTNERDFWKTTVHRFQRGLPRHCEIDLAPFYARTVFDRFSVFSTWSVRGRVFRSSRPPPTPVAAGMVRRTRGPA